jgi:hypothetical protein
MQPHISFLLFSVSPKIQAASFGELDFEQKSSITREGVQWYVESK